MKRTLALLVLLGLAACERNGTDYGGCGHGIKCDASRAARPDAGARDADGGDGRDGD